MFLHFYKVPLPISYGAHDMQASVRMQTSVRVPHEGTWHMNTHQTAVHLKTFVLSSVFDNNFNLA